MGSIAVVVLHAVLAHVHSKELVLNDTADMKNFTDKLVDKLVSRALAAIPQASRPAIFGKTPLSMFRSFGSTRSALTPHARHTIVSYAGLDEDSRTISKRALGARPELAKNAMAAWPAKYRNLFKQGLKPVTPQEALKMMQTRISPAKLVDVRLESRFTTGHSQGAINVPIVRIIQGNSAKAWSKRLFNLAFGVQPTERNPEFEVEALKQLDRNAPIIIVCDRGGTLEKGLTDQEVVTGLSRYTASLKAASELYEVGFKNLFFLKGGLMEWDRDGLPVEREDAMPIPGA